MWVSDIFVVEEKYVSYKIFLKSSNIKERADKKYHQISVRELVVLMSHGLLASGNKLQGKSISGFVLFCFFFQNSCAPVDRQGIKRSL